MTAHLTPLPNQSQELDPDDYRSLFRTYAAGVVVITADAGAGPVGFTATSLATVSLEPPLISFALSTTASSWPAIAVARSLVVNFLDAGQHSIAGRFATSGIDRFAAPTSWSRLAGGEPALDDAPSHLVARIEDRLPVGDHHVVVAHATKAVLRRHHAPLVYHAGRYGTVDGSAP